jgi:hypothetical protein
MSPIGADFIVAPEIVTNGPTIHGRQKNRPSGYGIELVTISERHDKIGAYPGSFPGDCRGQQVMIWVDECTIWSLPLS